MNSLGSSLLKASYARGLGLYLWPLPELLVGDGGVDAEVMDAEAGMLPAGLPALVASEDLGSIFPYFTRRMEA